MSLAHISSGASGSLGLVGKKIGMTRVFTEAGKSQPVTVVEATPNRVTQVKSGAIDGYDAVQVTAGQRRPSRVGKAMRGHFAKAGVEPGRGVWEFRLTQSADEIMLGAVNADGDANANANANDNDNENIDDAAADNNNQNADGNDDSGDAKPATAIAPGTELTVALFSEGQKVDVTGRTIGKGFAGVIKRHGFRGGRASHGNSKAHRKGGSTGNAQDPGRVFKGKKMAGHMGGVQRVQQGLEVIRVDRARNLLLISGAIPGAKGAFVTIRPSVKERA